VKKRVSQREVNVAKKLKAKKEESPALSQKAMTTSRKGCDRERTMYLNNLQIGREQKKKTTGRQLQELEKKGEGLGNWWQC